MDFYEEASLVMVPSGYKDQKVYSSVPDDGSADLTFSRASTATRVNSDGYIEKAQVNLLLQSNTFNTTWALQNSTISGGQSGYDGTSDAWLLERLSTGAASLYQMGSFSGIYTASIYAKAGTADAIRFRVDQTTDANLYVDLTDGSIITSNGIIGSNVESIGGGWYRISMAFNAVGYVNTQVRVIDGAGAAFAGNIYIQDAQLNYGLVAQDYIETTTASVTEGVAIDVPRLNYDPVNPTSASLLLEPSRTNGNAHSEFFGGTGFGIVAATQTPNAATSPEGVTNATSFVGSASTAEHIIYTNGSSTYNGNTTVSIFAKANGYDYFVLGAGAQSLNKPVLFNIANGTKVGNFTGWTSYGAPIDSNIEDYGNGWYRLSVTFDATSGVNTNMFFGSLPTDSVASGANLSTQNGTDGSYVYGAFIESGSYPTSYIPTYGSSATRTADDMDTTFASAFATDGGATLFYEIDGTPPSGTNATGAHYAIYFSSNDYISYNRSGGGIHRVRVNANSVANYFQTGVDSTDTVKICASVTASNATVYANGVLVNSVSITGSWASATNLVTTINDIIGSIPVKQLILFPTALTATQLAELTTL